MHLAKPTARRKFIKGDRVKRKRKKKDHYSTQGQQRRLQMESETGQWGFLEYEMW
jgi:hypothetical protein